MQLQQSDWRMNGGSGPKAGQPIRLVLGKPEESISFDFGAEEAESPGAAILAFPPKK